MFFVFSDSGRPIEAWRPKRNTQYGSDSPGFGVESGYLMYDARMRFSAITYCILSLIAGLVYAPFFHVHQDHGAELHAHFDSVEEHAEPHHDDHAAVEASEDEHHGTSVSVFVAQTPAVNASLFETREAHIETPEPTLVGFVVAQAVHAHDPPHLRISNPRSPPA